MTVISEDTPEGNSEELQWEVEQLAAIVKRLTEELQQERNAHHGTWKSLTEARERFDALTASLTVGTLRKAGYAVEIQPPCEEYY
jgi:hypothetical protein